MCQPEGGLRRNGEDIHARTAREMFGEVDRDTRGRAKTINFAILYGISRWGLAARLGVPPKRRRR
jgi:DNA polymerase I